MVNNKTYNNVVNTLLRLAEHHRQIHTTSVGDIFDIDLSKETKFPLLHKLILYFFQTPQNTR